MTQQTINIRQPGSIRSLKKEIRNLSAVLVGSLRKHAKIRNTFYSYLVYHLFEKIHKAFLIKSDGGTDDVGQSWKPLKRETIAARPMQKGEWKQYLSNNDKFFETYEGYISSNDGPKGDKQKIGKLAEKLKETR